MKEFPQSHVREATSTSAVNMESPISHYYLMNMLYYCEPIRAKFCSGPRSPQGKHMGFEILLFKVSLDCKTYVNMCLKVPQTLNASSLVLEELPLPGSKDLLCPYPQL